MSIATLTFNFVQTRRRDTTSAVRGAAIQALQVKQKEQDIKRSDIEILQGQLMRMDSRLVAAEKEQDRLRAENADLNRLQGASISEIARLTIQVRSGEERHAELMEENKALHAEVAILRSTIEAKGIVVPPLRRTQSALGGTAGDSAGG